MKKQIREFSGEHDFLSNKHPSTFHYEGVKYKSVAHAYYSLKLKNQKDADRVRKCKTAEDAMKESRACESREDWQDIAKETMKSLLYAKFSSNIFLSPKLLSTGDAILGDGRNFVGSLLMEIRDKISKEKSPDG
jgi:predicted NAD-dependent protein-ADP-ribosyltransferase YbiA (DUF1768 family)